MKSACALLKLAAAVSIWLRTASKPALLATSFVFLESSLAWLSADVATSSCPKTRAASSSATPSKITKPHLIRVIPVFRPRLTLVLLSQLVFAILSSHPGFVTEHAAILVACRLITHQIRFPGDGLDHPQQGGADRRVIAANRAHRSHGNHVAIHLVDKQTALALWENNYSALMRGALCRFVFEVQPQRRQEDERQNERDHYVVMQAAALVAPENITADNFPDLSHPALAPFTVQSKSRSPSWQSKLVSTKKLARGWDMTFSKASRGQGCRAVILSLPMYGRSASGMSTLPSAC